MTKKRNHSNPMIKARGSKKQNASQQLIFVEGNVSRDERVDKRSNKRLGYNIVAKVDDNDETDFDENIALNSQIKNMKTPKN